MPLPSGRSRFFSFPERTLTPGRYAVVPRKGNTMANQNRPSQQNQSSGRKPGEQQGGGLKPGQQSQAPVKNDKNSKEPFDQTSDSDT
jgi:hypothetical protein